MLKNFLIFFLTLSVKTSLAWDGYDIKSQTTIDIGSGNLVRTNKIIQYFDFHANQFHDARVVDIISDLKETKLIVFDITLQQERTFIMED